MVLLLELDILGTSTALVFRKDDFGVGWWKLRRRRRYCWGLRRTGIVEAEELVLVHISGNVMSTLRTDPGKRKIFELLRQVLTRQLAHGRVCVCVAGRRR